MKRIVIIICSIVLLLSATVWTYYIIRKNNIEKQYVSKESTHIFSIAVDDLILDNLSSFNPWSGKSVDTAVDESWITGLLWHAGIEIPARIYLFSMTDRAPQFYGILALKNYDECFSFFANRYPNGISFLDKEQGVVRVSVNNHIKVIFDRNNLIYKIDRERNSGFEDLHLLLKQPNTWVQIDSFPEFKNIHSNKHISYIQKDKKLKLEASIAKHKIDITGEWLISQDLDKKFPVRAMDTTNQAMTFWTMLSLDDMPLLADLMHKYTGLDQLQLQNAYANYFDLQVKSDVTIQRDTLITYSYDDDFNPIEEKKINEINVPYIAHAWIDNNALAESLPTTMFYKFYKQRKSGFLLNTTTQSTPNLVKIEETSYPFYLYINFGKWPDTWLVEPFDKLKANQVKVEVSTIIQNKNSLSIQGQINY
ncbi:hypothetical protein ACFX5U_10150 [Sphingobacterium sp. SG20118]|uniref:hypothetical protein n=1 Tax=Sphingobacterium sp. SG20118 TaxID=3367156 RepID=UPI0037DFC6DF